MLFNPTNISKTLRIDDITDPKLSQKFVALFRMLELMQVGISKAFDIADTTQVYTFATLPTPALGLRTFISDSSVTTFLSTAAGGGANTVPVFYNGTNWIVG